MSLDTMKQALEALNDCTYDEEGYCLNPDNVDAILALRAAIEQAQPDELMIWKSRALHAERMIEKFMQPEQEPVAWMYHGIRHDDTPHERPSLIWKPEYMDVMSFEKGAKATPLYTAPRQWQGLTDEEIWELAANCLDSVTGRLQFARAIEAKLREKNA